MLNKFDSWINAVNKHENTVVRSQICYLKWGRSLTLETYRSLANAKRPCDCSVLRLRPKSSLCRRPHFILEITSSLGSADSVRHASNNGVGQFKPIFQVEGNIFRPIFSFFS